MARIAGLRGTAILDTSWLLELYRVTGYFRSHEPPKSVLKPQRSSTPDASSSSPCRCCSKWRATSRTSGAETVVAFSALDSEMTSRAPSIMIVRGRSPPSDRRFFCGLGMSSSWPGDSWSRLVPSTPSPTSRSSTSPRCFAGRGDRSRYWPSTRSSNHTLIDFLDCAPIASMTASRQPRRRKMTR